MTDLEVPRAARLSGVDDALSKRSDRPKRDRPKKRGAAVAVPRPAPDDPAPGEPPRRPLDLLT
jgi:hypothetical protein